MSCCDTISFVGLLLFLYILYKVIDRLVRIPRIGRYGDHYVLVTGCGQGFGLEAVRRLEKLGCHVFAGCRKQESVQELRETFSDRVHPILLDISNRDNVRSAFEYVTSQLPKNKGLWGLVNNAGIGEVLPFELIDVARYRRLAETNLLGTIDVTMTFLPLVKKARGRIVNISSYSGRIVLPVVVSYAMSKFGIEAFTDGLRRSLQPFRCKALLVEPGSVKTSILNIEKVLEEFDVAFRSKNSADQRTESTEKLLNAEREKLSNLLTGYPTYGQIGDVIDAYEHALFGVYPRARYVVGIDAKILMFLQTLPEWFSDWVICASMPTFQSHRDPEL